MSFADQLRAREKEAQKPNQTGVQSGFNFNWAQNLFKKNQAPINPKKLKEEVFGQEKARTIPN